MNNKKVIIFALFSIIVLLLIVMIGPADVFKNGYFCDEEFPFDVAEDDVLAPIALTGDGCDFTICPHKRNLRGFEIRLIDQTEKPIGYLVIKISDENGEVIECQKIPIEDTENMNWYKVYVNESYSSNHEYFINISTENTVNAPSIVTVDEDYLSDEIVEGNAAVVLAYAHSTFSFSEKILLILVMIGIWIMVYRFIFMKENRYLLYSVETIFLTVGLTWIFMFNSLDKMNSSFNTFEEYSETLVTGVISAEEGGIWFEEEREIGYGLGRLRTNLGEYHSYSEEPLTNESFLNGYHVSEPIISVRKNLYTERLLVDGAAVRFSNAEQFWMVDFEEDNDYIYIELAAERPFNKYKFGDVEDVTFVLKDGTEIHTGRLLAYTSQYGLQGKVYRHISRYLSDDNELEVLHLINSMLTALILSIIVILLTLKYNVLLGGVFYCTFLLSPWVVNFGRNLYWVEFTWFLPMLVGLICIMHIENRKMRVISYGLTFFTILIKSLCGYEYISSVMLELISFMLIEAINAFFNHDRKQVLLITRTILISGIIALLGFMAAIVIHASLRGDGSILEGIHSIIEQDVLRRTNGANLNNFNSVYWPSMNASIWEVFCKYFKFDTEVLTGITGNLFPVLCIVPIVIFGYDLCRKKTINIRMVAAYVVFFLTTISWLCLAKSHSYIHTHLNYVLWYFGFVQTCIYIIISRVVIVISSTDSKMGDS